MKLLKMDQGPGHRYENNYKLTSINVDGSMLIGKNLALMDDKIVAQRSGPIDVVLN